MFEEFRTRDRSVLGDMSDQEDGRAGFFGEALEFGGAFPDLGNTARGCIQERGLQGLDGVDDDQSGFYLTDLLEDLAGGCFGEQVEVVVTQPKAVGPHLHLVFTFFTGDVKGAHVLHPQGVLQEEGGFTDAGFSCGQHEASGHNTSAEYPVEFGVGCQNSFFLLPLDLIERHAFGGGCRGTLISPG